MRKDLWCKSRSDTNHTRTIVFCITSHIRPKFNPSRSIRRWPLFHDSLIPYFSVHRTRYAFYMRSLIALAIAALTVPALAATRPVPAHCTPQVNRELARFAASNSSNREAHADNIMVCGTATHDAFSQRASRRTHAGPHQVIMLSAPGPHGQAIAVEIVTNDDLDGVVRVNTGDTVFAYGQAYIPSPHERRPGGIHFAAGIHDTHCSTHRGADDGWVVVNSARYPTRPCRIR